MENYEQKYKDAMARLELVVRTGLKIDPVYIFPELAESEGERISRTVYDILHLDNTEIRELLKSRNLTYTDIWTYLEKQKESLHIPESCKENSDSLTYSSEDERVRKAIVSLVHENSYSYKSFAGVELCDMLSYLEKQKEQPQEELVYRMNGLMIEYIKEGKDDVEKEHRFKCYRLFWDALEDADFFEQKEQKPVEWSEEDERNIETLISVIWEHYAACDLVRDDYPINAEGLVDWLKSLRDRIKEK